MLHVDREGDLITIKSDNAVRIGHLVAAPAFADRAVQATRDLYALHGWNEEDDHDRLERQFDRIRVRISRTFALACGRRDEGSYDFPHGDAPSQRLIGLYRGLPVTLRERIHAELTKPAIGRQLDHTTWARLPDYYLALADVELRDRLQAQAVADGCWVKAEIRIDAATEQARVVAWLVEKLAGKFDLFGVA